MRDAPPPRPTRQAYRDALVRLMAADERVVCLDTDTGLFAGVEFGPAADRYLPFGIAEHVLMGAAAGLAADGRVPFVNTMAAFAASRAAEAVKIDIAYNGLPVRIAATHGGLSAGHLGPTHHALEDLGIMRALPGMTVVVPADAAQTELFVAQSADLPGPLYLRLGRKATPPLPLPLAAAVPASALAPPPASASAPVIGRLQRLREGRDVVMIGCGPHPLQAALAAADELAADGVGVGVLNAHTLKPLDTSGLLAAVADAALVVTVEDHWRTGGLGSAVAEALAEAAPRRLIRVGMPDTFCGVVGDHEYLLEHYGVHATVVADRVRQAIGLIPVEV